MNLISSPQPHVPNEVRAYSIGDVCRITTLGRTKVYGEIAAGRIRTLKVGRRTIIPTTEIEAFFQRLAANNDSSEGVR